MRLCSECSELKTLGSFTKNLTKCRDCWCAIGRAKSKETYKINQVMIVESRNSSCEGCGMYKSSNIPGFFEWHHIDPSNKEASVATLCKHLDTTRLLAEADKCLMLCPNCHKLEHLVGEMGRSYLISQGIKNKKEKSDG